MDLLVYRIDRSLWGWVVKLFKEPPLPAMAAGVMRLDFVNKIQRTLNDIVKDNFYVLTKEEEINRFEDPRGYDLVDNVYYFRHPKKMRTNWLIPAHDFHHFIVREQLADLVGYILSNLNVKKIEIEINTDKGGKLEIGTTLEEVSVQGKINIDVSKKFKMVLNCEEPLKPSEKRREYVWLEDFPNTVAIIDSVAKSQFKIEEKFNTSFGIDVKIADILQLDTKWLDNFHWQLEVICN